MGAVGSPLAHKLLVAPHLPDYAAHVSWQEIPGKGRGLRAVRNLPGGTILMINRPLVAAKLSEKSAITTRVDGQRAGRWTASAASSVMVAAKAVQAAVRLPLVATTLAALDDYLPGAAGATARRPLTVGRLEDMQQRLSPRVLPLLPATARFFPVAERRPPGAAFVERVCEVNAHGNTGSEGEGVDVEGRLTHMFAVVSLLNHSKRCNCHIGPLSFVRKGLRLKQGGSRDVMMVYTCQPIAAGEELTVSYSDDAKVVKSKWGISS